MADKKISQLQNLLRSNYTSNDLLLINHGLAPYSAQTTSNTKVFDFIKYFTGTTNFITGLTFNSGTLVINFNGTLQSIPVTGFTTTYLTGGTYSSSASATTFTNNTGGTFTVTGMYFEKKPAGTLNSIQYNNNYKFSGNTLIYNSGTTSVYNRGYNSITGNTFYGEDSGNNSNITGTTVFGYHSLYQPTTPSNDILAFGSETNSIIMGGKYNISVGYRANYSSSTSNSGNTFVGNVGESFVGGTYNTLYGSLILKGQTGAYSTTNNTVLGTKSFYSGYSTNNNIIGYNSYLYDNLPGSGYGQTGQNVLLGNNSITSGLSFSYYGSTGAFTSIGNNIIPYVNQGVPVQNPGQAVIVGNNVLTGMSYVSDFVVLGNNVGKYGGGISELTVYIGDGTNSFKNSSIAYLQNDNDVLIGTYLSQTKLSTLRGDRIVVGHKLSASVRNNNGHFINVGYNNLTNLEHEDYYTVIGSGIFKNSTTSQTRSLVAIGNDIFINATLPMSTSIYIGNNVGLFGSGAKYNSTLLGNYNSANMASSTDNGQNTSIGAYAGYNNQDIHAATTFGSYSLYNNNTLSYENTSLGYQSSYNLVTGNYNTFVGALAGYSLTGGSNNTFIGYNTNYSATTANNIIYIGNTSVSNIYSQQTSITLLSDIRDKKNIKELKLGVDFINKLKPSKFEWSLREGKRDNPKSSGFIAQEIQEVESSFESAEYTNISQKISDEYLTVSYNNLIPIMVKSLQDLSKKNKELKERIKNLTI